MEINSANTNNSQAFTICYPAELEQRLLSLESDVQDLNTMLEKTKDQPHLEDVYDDIERLESQINAAFDNMNEYLTLNGHQTMPGYLDAIKERLSYIENKQSSASTLPYGISDKVAVDITNAQGDKNWLARIISDEQNFRRWKYGFTLVSSLVAVSVTTTICFCAYIIL